MAEEKKVELADTQPQPEHTLDFFVKKRAKNKRPYIFRYKKARVCDHPTMRILARGSTWYSCPDCNYSFDIIGANIWPRHFTAIMGMFLALGFAKDFGTDAFFEVLRTPIGQTDGTPHKPVLPEGMSFYDTIHALEAIDTSQEDGGQQQLLALVESLWVSPMEHKKWLKEHHPEQLKALEKGDDGDGNTDEMPSLPVPRGSDSENGSEGKSSNSGT